MALLLTKEKFCYYIGRMQAAWDNNVMIDSTTSEPYLIDEICMLLEDVMDDEEGVIGDYCFEYNFGRVKNDSLLQDSPAFSLNSAEELYDYFVSDARE